ncbi:hypothetical protein DFH06DRAFT_1484792 [Mycena polygramma]|nr:hypothetical protein DFH06DRAFT_1484792 [Mycena polygramma]
MTFWRAGSAGCCWLVWRQARQLKNILLMISIAGIVDTDAPGLVAPSARRGRTSSTLRKADVKLTDIPDDIRPLFRTKFAPDLIEFTGHLDAWCDPSPEDVVNIWNSVFPKHAVSTTAERDKNLVLVITKLAQDKIDGWRNRFGGTGISTWTGVFKGKTKEETIADVEWYLSGSDRDRVFYYRDVVQDPDGGEPKFKGLFQSYVFSQVFAVHCSATATGGKLGPLAYPAIVPVGALTLACHAIKRGLNYYRTGELVIPQGSLGQFSKTNWADHMDFSEGVPKLIPSTSAITAVVKKLKEGHWTKIIAAARAAERTDFSKAAVIDVDANTDPVESDFELVDDDSDV